MSKIQGKPTQNWNDFVKEYLLTEYESTVSGACMSTKQGIPVLNYGELSHLKQADMKYFLSLFNPKPKQEDELNEIYLPNTRFKFRVICQTYKSIYGTACDRNGTGLLINNLPQGVLVCIYHHPVSREVAVNRVEAFCDRLCA
ncbi:hypothetical protein SNE40_009344 [Patella caerulea]|uniref:Profilin n=1 Tax=Patella caerulea TaxID=87958 RepID=A0AAN8JRY6_PATCE